MRPKIVIDAGHGGNDPGAVEDNKKEKDITLNIARMLFDSMVKIAIPYLTRCDDSTVSLEERVKFANSLGADYFISLHCNASVNRSAKGVETFVYKRGGQAERIANVIQKELVKETWMFDRRVKTANFYVLRKTKMPAVLVELGFISNEEDRKKLINPAFQKKIACAITNALRSFLNVDIDDQIEIYVENKKISGRLIEGEGYCSVRKLCELLGKKVEYDSKTKMIYVK